MNEPDNRVEMELDIEDELLFALMKAAHEQDVTLNQYIEHLLRECAENNLLEGKKS